MELLAASGSLSAEQRIGAAQPGSLDRSSQDRAKLGSLAEVDESAECSFGVGCRGVQEDPGHWFGALPSARL